MKIKSKKSIVISTLIVLFFILLALNGTIMSQVNEPTFKIVDSHGNIEIRDYDPLIVAQIKVDADRKSAISIGFRALADYIFGNNRGQQKLSMTAPVLQQKGITLAMTAPVLQESSETENQWYIKFVMPPEYTLKTLPQPINNEIELIPLPSKRYAVIRFSGSPSEESLKIHLKKLREHLKAEKFQLIGEPLFAFYNPPWTLPFLRRNEVMIELNK